MQTWTACLCTALSTVNGRETQYARVISCKVSVACDPITICKEGWQFSRANKQKAFPHLAVVLRPSFFFRKFAKAKRLELSRPKMFCSARNPPPCMITNLQNLFVSVTDYLQCQLCDRISFVGAKNCEFTSLY